jgi:peptidoglycan/xylan/chitin deacetylase (PgdA/CDA1 family)
VAGETLANIARGYDTTWQSLLYWNRATYPSLDPDDASYDPDVIRVGWALRLIPGTSVPFEAPLPTHPATPMPTTPPTAPPTGTASTLVGSGSRATALVALTFDMGGRVEPAIPIMTWLRDHGVPATIFMTGSMADSTATDAGRQVLAMLDARPALFDLGNHSYAHPDMTTLPAASITDEIARAETAIGRHAGQGPRPFFRPPFGAWNETVLSAVGSAGYRYTVMWDVDTIDWKPMADGGPTAQQIIDKVVGRAQGGSIVLMHLGGYETLDALPGIVAGLQARGLTLVTLGTMLGS